MGHDARKELMKELTKRQQMSLESLAKELEGHTKEWLQGREKEVERRECRECLHSHRVQLMDREKREAYAAALAAECAEERDAAQHTLSRLRDFAPIDLYAMEWAKGEDEGWGLAIKAVQQELKSILGIEDAGNMFQHRRK